MTKPLTAAKKAARQTAKDAASEPLTMAPQGFQTQRPQGAPKPKSAGQKMLDSLPHSGTLSIGCRLPSGLMLQLFSPTEMSVPTPGGNLKTEVLHRPNGERVKLNGFAVPFGARPNFPIIGHYGITEVDADFFRKYVEQNLDADIFKNGLVFVAKSERDAVQMAKDLDPHTKSNLEGLNPEGDARVAKTRSKNVTDIEKMEGSPG